MKEPAGPSQPSNVTRSKVRGDSIHAMANQLRDFFSSVSRLFGVAFGFLLGLGPYASVVLAGHGLANFLNP